MYPKATDLSSLVFISVDATGRDREQRSNWEVRIFLKKGGRGCQSVLDWTDLYFLLHVYSWLAVH